RQARAGLRGLADRERCAGPVEVDVLGDKSDRQARDDLVDLGEGSDVSGDPARSGRRLDPAEAERGVPACPAGDVETHVADPSRDQAPDRSTAPGAGCRTEPARAV